VNGKAELDIVECKKQHPIVKEGDSQLLNGHGRHQQRTSHPASKQYSAHCIGFS
jgi:hypothetical protein